MTQRAEPNPMNLGQLLAALAEIEAPADAMPMVWVHGQWYVLEATVTTAVIEDDPDRRAVLFIGRPLLRLRAEARVEPGDG